MKNQIYYGGSNDFENQMLIAIISLLNNKFKETL